MKSLMLTAWKFDRCDRSRAQIERVENHEIGAVLGTPTGHSH